MGKQRTGGNDVGAGVGVSDMRWHHGSGQRPASDSCSQYKEYAKFVGKHVSNVGGLLGVGDAGSGVGDGSGFDSGSGSGSGSGAGPDVGAGVAGGEMGA